MKQTIQDSRIILEQLLPQRYLTDRIIGFLNDEGILGIITAGRKLGMEEIMHMLQSGLDYQLTGDARPRMVRVMIDLLCECGFMRREGGYYVCNGIDGPLSGLSDDDVENLRTNFSGQIDFFEECISYAGKFLRGAPPLYGFNDDSMIVWENFLGNMEFEFARSLLMKSLMAGQNDDCRLLDLCCGPGFDIIQVEDLMPDVKITALDFKDIFYRRAIKRARNPSAVQWINSDVWKGFGAPLPFDDESFDIVFFACADPYVSEELREYVYRDIFRILRRGGALGILTNSYPDPERKHVKNVWIRRGVLCHDFAESVCDGWNGFYAPDASERLFRAVGYDIYLVMLNHSIWRLDKP